MNLRRALTTASATIGLAVWALVIAPPVNAARVTPMVAEIEPSGSGSTLRLEVSNSEDRAIPFEITMHRGVISEDGNVTLEPADDRFVVFPPQTVLQAQGQQVFRIQHIPDRSTNQSEIYYASVSQLPVALSQDESRIQMLMRFNVLINVVPRGTRSAPKIEWIKSAERVIAPEDDAATEVDESAETKTLSGIEVRISNQGDRYFGAGQTNWTVNGTTLDGSPFSQRFSDSEVRLHTGLGIVAPSAARIFFIPLEDKLDPESVDITFG